MKQNFNMFIGAAKRKKLFCFKIITVILIKIIIEGCQGETDGKTNSHKIGTRKD